VFEVTHKCNETDEMLSSFETLEANDHSHQLLVCDVCNETLTIVSGTIAPRRVSPSGTSLESVSASPRWAVHESVNQPQQTQLALPLGKLIHLPGGKEHAIPLVSGLAGPSNSTEHNPRGGEIN